MGRKVLAKVGIDARTWASLREIADKETAGRIVPALKKIVTEAYELRTKGIEITCDGERILKYGHTEFADFPEVATERVFDPKAYEDQPNA